MQTKVLLRFVAFFVSVSLLGACGPRPLLPFVLPFGNPTSTSTATPSPIPPTSTPRAEGLCSNSLIPVKTGATWTYVANASGAGGPSSFSTTIMDVRPDGFTTAIKMGDNLTVNQGWACEPDGLVALSMGAAQDLLGLSAQGIKADLKTSNATGVTLPADVGTGRQWSYNLDLAGDLAQGGLSAKASGSASTAFTAVGTETITVPAGTFDAIKVQGTTTFKMTVDFQGFGVPVTSVVKSTLWFAPGIGWIQSTASGDLLETALSATTQLQSYSIP